MSDLSATDIAKQLRRRRTFAIISHPEQSF
jgi:peptide subunit release factor RF-3